MRSITREITLPLDGGAADFRLTRLDAFSGVFLLRLLQRYMPEGEGGVPRFLADVPDYEMRVLMRACLNHAEIRLPAGWTPVMAGDEWEAPDLRYDTVSCVRLTAEVIRWTLADFFPGSGQDSPPAPPAA